MKYVGEDNISAENTLVEAIEAFRRRKRSICSVVEHKFCSLISWIVLLGNSVLMVSGRVASWTRHMIEAKLHPTSHSTCPRAFLYPLSLDDFP